MHCKSSGWFAKEKSGDLRLGHSVRPILILALCAGMTACTSAFQSAATKTSSGTQSGSSGTMVKVDISPDSSSVAAGGKLQFAATVTNAITPAVTWTASGGSITTGGLFTAPSTKGAESITIVATSVASPASEASVTVTVVPTAVRLAIATNSLPTGTAGADYSATLTASGGSQPYQWSVSQGSLPSGIQLNAQSGALSGLTSKSGSFPFSVQILDATGASSSENLSLTINAQGGTNCGPPTYPCSRSDNALLTPTAPPRLGANPVYLGGHLGAGFVTADPVYNNNRILRVTDGNTDPSYPGQSYATGSSAEKNVTSYDETLFMLHAATGVCLFQFDAATFSATYHGCFNNVSTDLDFGYTEADQRAFYGYYQEKLYRFVVNTSNWTIAPDPSFNGGLGYFDPDNAECLNGQIAANKWFVADMALSSDDNTVIAAVGPEQDKNPYYVIWDATKGCQWLNVQTWQVSQGWNTGLKNPVKIDWASGNTPTQVGGIHNAQIDRSGGYGVLTVHGVTTLVQKLFWTIGTNKVDDTCVKCTSHWACDFGVCFWDLGGGSYDLGSQQIGSLSPVPNMNTSVATGEIGNDVHVSHANAIEGQTLIYLAAWQPGAGGSTISQVWEDEVAGISWDGSLRTIRFNKTWTTGYSFNSSARCSISRQGHYAICGSDYQMYNLDRGFGNGLNQDTCDHLLTAGLTGTNGCRIDALLFELR